ncbi:GNAT family N-acetyltransferase [Priestia flexa]|uniref:GNAT family N-acetyltransferase n=1 Tax=Priestia TaxID=2800373 RepID=UPI000473A4E5|nr:MULTISPECIES: GNAT family N-acetyltransferase [Priestia]SCC33898.1 Acetyltransferase (GNAT) family protein [Priestia flexa]
MEIRRVVLDDREEVSRFLEKHWGSTKMVTSVGAYDCSSLCGFILYDEHNNIIGLVTYEIREKECEIISLDSLQENSGYGTALMKAVEEKAKSVGCTKVTLITTNDNVKALRFYQRRGYHLAYLFPNAVQEARKQKPSIPLVGYDEIPIRDELLLMKKL